MKLIIERGRIWQFEDLPPHSIALDGAVQGPRIDMERMVLSLDHHDGCIRLVTSATCRQVLDALLLGLNPEPFTVYVNDIDGDTAMSVWLLQHPSEASNPLVRALVECVAGMDAHGPAYLPVQSGLCTAFYEGAMAPERDARRNKSYGTCDLRQLLDTCVARISQLIEGGPAAFAVTKPPALPWSVTHEGKGWVMVSCEGFVFGQLYESGITAAVAYRQLGPDNYEYTIAKKSDLVRFPLGPHTKPGTVLHRLASLEPGWGGGSSIGGAPRHPSGARSSLPPSKVIEIIEEVLG